MQNYGPYALSKFLLQDFEIIFGKERENEEEFLILL